MQYYDFNVTVNGARALESAGTYCYYYSGSAGSADPTITLKEDTTGTTIILKPGQGIELPRAEGQALRWYIGNYANAATITGILVIGNGRIIDNRLTGQVTVVDSAYMATVAGQAFAANVSYTAGGGLMPHCQIKNPAASGKITVITGVSMSCNLATGVGMTFYSTDLTTAIGGVTSKLASGAPALSTLIKSQTNATVIWANQIWGGNLAANGFVEKVFPKPLVLKPGDGLGIVMTTLASAMTVNFDGEEYTA